MAWAPIERPTPHTHKLIMGEIDSAIATAAQALRQTAKGHKQAARYHRDRAREAMQKLEELKRIASRHGIILIIDGEEIGEKTHGRKKGAPQHNHRSRT
jgi:hypothetical protein